jgi:sorting nexin-29
MQNKSICSPFRTIFHTKRIKIRECAGSLASNIALEKVIRDSGVERQGTIYYKSVQVLAYADDLDIIGRSERDVKEAFLKLNNEAQKMCLNINKEKKIYRDNC